MTIEIVSEKASESKVLLRSPGGLFLWTAEVSVAESFIYLISWPESSDHWRTISMRLFIHVHLYIRETLHSSLSHVNGFAHQRQKYRSWRSCRREKVHVTCSCVYEVLNTAGVCCFLHSYTTISASSFHAGTFTLPCLLLWLVRNFFFFFLFSFALFLVLPSIIHDSIKLCS